MKSFNIIYNGNEILENFIEVSELNKKNVLLQIFTGVMDKNKILNLIKFVKKLIPDIKIIGSSTDGEIIDGQVTQNQIILNFNVFESTTINTTLIEKKATSRELGRKLADKLIEDDTKILFTFTDGLNTNGEEFIKGINEIKTTIIAGGLAGDNGKFKETFVFNENGLTTKGCVGAALNSKVLKVNNEYGFNWEGVGKLMTITKSDENIVYEIDGKTPVEIYRYYFGEEIAQDIVQIGVEFPLVIKKGDMRVARAVMSQNEDGSLVFAGNLEEGDLVQFGYGNIESILEKDENLFRNMKDFDVESIFIYSCMARRRFLGDKVKYEIQPFAQIADVNGFFTYGEFFSYNLENIFLNQTMTVLVLSEKEQKKEIDYTLDFPKDELRTLKALTNLIHATSQELMQLNNSLEEKVKQKTTKLKSKNQELEYLYYHDNLTDLPNKHMLDRDLLAYKATGCLLLDIKEFSKVNDLYGEFVGDKILKLFAYKLKDEVKEFNAKLYRFGSDQFIILSKEDECIRCISDKIEASVKHKPIIVEVDDSVINISLQIRRAVVSAKGESMKLKADLALKYAKIHHLDFIEYSESLKLEEKLERELKIINMVKSAIEEDRVVPVFQKIKKKIGDSYECLVRIKDGNRLISPFFFLDDIHNTNYYYDITRIMIEKSFKFFKDRKESISINFSYKDIESDDMVDYLIYKIKEYNMQSRVIIELLESESLNDFDVIKAFILKVREYGVKIAIDDFGSGYSNFIYLSEIKPDFIKIDGSLIKNIDNDENSFIIAKNINNFAKELGCDTIAEYVHNKSVYDKLEDLRIDGIQGYFIHEPNEEV